MKNENYFRSRELCGNLSSIFGLTRHLTHSFTRIIAQGIVHQIAESAIDKDDGRLNIFSIDIPFIGRLDMEYNNGEVRVNNVELEQDFSKWIEDAIVEGKSPLVVESEKALIESIKSRYNSLI